MALPGKLALWAVLLLLGPTPGCSSSGDATDLGAPDLPPADISPLDAADAAADAGEEGGCIQPPEPPPDQPIPDLPLPDAPADASPDIAAPDGPVVDGTPDAATDLALPDGPAADAGPDTGPDAAPDGPGADITPDLPAPCPSCMVLVNNTFCIDIYEASRPDATSTSQGTSTAKAVCAPSVIPWYSTALTKAEAAGACAAAGKRLCTPAEWTLACSGTTNKAYAYGNAYNPTTCNGIDTFCLCGAGTTCANVTPCPYPHCFNMPPPSGTPATGCGAWFHVVPTGSFPSCVDEWGVHDLNGNVWELVDTADALLHFRGCAYNCGDSEALHRCDYDATWGPSAQGFRCCADPLPLD